MGDAEPAAPKLPIPGDVVVNIEHPGIVKNIDRAVASLGGEERLGQYLHDGASERSERNLKLNLCPEDIFRTGIDASTAQVSNLVLRISVPKWTGRRRRKGTSDAFKDAPSGWQPSVKTGDLLRLLRDNADAYTVQVAGQCNESHRFRRLPDFQYSVMGNPTAEHLSQTIMSFDYDKIKAFKLRSDSKDGHAQLDLLPPPRFSQLDVPFNYMYMDNPAVSHVSGADGRVEAQLRSARVRSRVHMLRADAERVPETPLEDCQPEDQLSPHVSKVLADLRGLLEQRPVITRRAALNLMNPQYVYDLRMAVQYCSYMFKSGPFKDSYCKMGVDPRRDPEMRKYQTLGFQLKKRGLYAEPSAKWSYATKEYPEKRGDARNTVSHIFDGLSPPSNEGRTWQVCDITDPFLVRLLAQAPIREEFDQDSDGWFQNGTWATLRTVIKDKMDLLMAGLVPNDADYERLLELPSTITESNLHECILTEEKGTKLSSLSSSIRNLARQELGARRFPRARQHTTAGATAEESAPDAPEEPYQDQDKEPEDDDEDMEEADGLDQSSAEEEDEMDE